MLQANGAPDAATTPAEGLDLSHHNDVLSFHEIAADGISFVSLKAVEGSYVDPTFADRWPRAKAVGGLIRGAYAYFDPTMPGDVQAHRLLQEAPPADGDLLHMLDIETLVRTGSRASVAPELVAQRAQHAWVTMKAETGRYPLIYAGEYFYETVLAGVLPASLATLWLARYRQAPPDTPCLIWQYTATGVVAGVSGLVDRDRCALGVAELRRHTYGAPS